MRRDKVVSYYGNLEDNELAILGGKVAGFMTDNAHFPDIKPTAAELGAAAEDFRLKLEIAVNGGSTQQKEQKKESKAALVDKLRELAYAVNVVAKGSTTMLSSTGLRFAKAAEASVEPGVTERIVTRDGRISGQLRVDFTKVYNAWEYEIQIGQLDTVSGQVTWEQPYYTTSSTGNIIAPLTAGQRYYVRVRARNGKGYGDWSDMVSALVR